jgi:hypothetical protein
MSFCAFLTPPGRPQSIVHRFGRMKNNISLPFGKKSEKTTSPKKEKKEKKVKKTRKSKNVRRSETSKSPEKSTASVALTTSTIDELGSTCYSTEDFSERGALEEKLAISTDENEEEFFVALNQNEFLIERFMTNECSDVTFIVHFDAEDSALAEHIEDVVLIRSMEAASNCQCRRVNSRKTPLFTAKFGIDPEQPTIVAIRNGKVVDRITDISSGCWELENWLQETGILSHQTDRDVFPNMNIHSC